MAPWLTAPFVRSVATARLTNRPVSFTSPGADQRLTVNSPSRIEPTEKALPCLDCIKAVLREREGTGTRRRPGIDQASSG